MMKNLNIFTAHKSSYYMGYLNQKNSEVSLFVTPAKYRKLATFCQIAHLTLLIWALATPVVN